MTAPVSPRPAAGRSTIRPPDGKTRGAQAAVDAPWLNRRIVDVVLGLVCDVRDYNPADLIAELVEMGPETAAQIAVVACAMVDADAPIDEIRRWRHAGFVGHRDKPEETDTCPKGHVLSVDNVLSGGKSRQGKPVWRCLACRKSREARAA